MNESGEGQPPRQPVTVILEHGDMMRYMKAFLILLCISAPAWAQSRATYNSAALVGTDLGFTKETVTSVQDTGTILGYQPVYDRRVYGGYRYNPVYGTKTVKWTETFTLSLQEGDSPWKGTAWLVRETTQGGPGTYQAWRGMYQLFSVKDDPDRREVRLGMVRSYTGTKTKDGIGWATDTKYEPKAVIFDLDVTDDTIPEKPVLAAKEAFFIEPAGNLMYRYSSPSTFIQKLAGEGELRTARPDFVTMGSTLRLVPVDARKRSFADEMPAGFKLRRKK